MNTTPRTVLLLMLCSASTVQTQDSRRGTYHAERVFDGVAQTALEVNRLTVTIAGARTDVRATITKAIAYDVGPPAVGVFESGSCVLLDAFHGILEFYDPRGTLVHTARPLKDAGPELERVMPFAVHDFSVTIAASEPGRAGIQLSRFTERGESVFAADLDGTFATAVVMSHSGTSTAVGTARWNTDGIEHTTYLITSSGLVEGTSPTACSFGAFAEGDSLLLVATPKEMTLLSVPEMSVRSRLPSGGGRIALDVAAKDGEFVVLSAASPSLRDGLWLYAELRVENIARDGTSRPVPGDIRQTFGSARFRNVGGEIVVEIDGELQPMR